jgi:SM-20-related protein
MAYALEYQADFKDSEVVSSAGISGVADDSYRRSRVLMDLGKHRDIVVQRIQNVLPGVLEQLGMQEFPVANIDAQITASNDGDFFAIHSDDGQELVASRHLTFVYFFHREPRPFEGGELRIYDSHNGNGSHAGYQTIAPQQNQIVFFPCSLMHEITPVHCPSGEFTDSRFTVNGWLHK